MNWTDVESSNIRRVGYDTQTRTLHVEFKSGGTYAYDGVPPEDHQSLVDAPSAGQHFHQNIRPNYSHRRV